MLFFCLVFAMPLCVSVYIVFENSAVPYCWYRSVVQPILQKRQRPFKSLQLQRN